MILWPLIKTDPIQYCMKHILLVFIISLFFQLESSGQGQKVKYSEDFIAPGGIEYLTSFKKNQAILMPDKTDETSGYEVRYMKMNLNIDPNELYISGSVSTTIQARVDLQQIKMELAKVFTIDSIIYQGNSLTFQHNDPYDLIIQFPATLSQGTRAEFTIYYRGVPSTDPGFGSVGIEDHEGIPAFWTLSEPYGARDWWPGKNDLTDKIDTTEIIVNTPQEFRAASNGILLTDTVIGDVRINHWKHNYPIVPYLVAVAVTNYAVYTDTTYSNGDFVPVLNYVYPEDLEEIRTRTEVTADFMELFSDLFMKYPFHEEKYGHAQFGWGGGMEHQTMSFMGRFDFEIIAHELAHQWFGDYVTLNSWHDIWLNEGFATYLAGLAYERMYDGYWWPRWKTISLNVITLLPDGSVYVDDTTNVTRIFDSRLSYRKASYMLHMLRWIVGDTAFFTICRNYLNDEQVRYGFVSTELFKSHAEEVSGKDLTEFFEDWYYGEGYPSYTLNVYSEEDQTFTLQLSQVTSDPSVDFFEMPVPVTFYSQEQDTTFILNHTSNGQTWSVNIPFTVFDSIRVDPEKWIITANNQVLLDSSEPQMLPNLEVYPNPTKDYFRITSAPRDARLYITDLKGAQVLSIEKFDRYKWIDVTSLKQGVYIIKLKSNQYEAKARLIKL